MTLTPLLQSVTAAAGLILAFASSASAAAPRLLPFQGRLTAATGTPVADGAKVVQFKIYDAPTGGTAVWSGEVHKLTVNGGLVSTLLGSKAELSGVDFNNPLYLEITVDSNGDDQITAADPPLLPRQSVLPAVFAVEAQEARGLKAGDGQTYDWSVLFGAESPATGRIDAALLAPGSIAANRLAPNSLTANEIGPNAVGSSELANNAVTSAKILDGTIQPADIAAGFGLVPTGTVVAFAGTTPPSGWLLCDGAVVSRTTYSVLFGAIGSGHGSGNGTTTFNLPDYRGSFLRGVDGQPDFPVAPSAVNVSTESITIGAHAFNRSSFPVRISNTGGTLPAPLSASATYYVIVVNATTIQLATSEANALANIPVNITTQGTGTHKIGSGMDPDRGTRLAMAPGGRAGNSVGSVQGDENKAHGHTMKQTVASHPPGGLAADAVYHFRTTTSVPGGMEGNVSAWTTSTNTAVAESGGPEARPRNAYVNYIIKF